MRQAIMTAAQPTVTIPVPKKKSSGLKDRKSSSRHAGQGTVHISTILDPIMEISSHPDRNRLLAEFFKG